MIAVDVKELLPLYALGILDADEAKAVEQAIARVRSATHDYQKTDVKDRFRSLRDELDEEDQMLLVLRVDRNLSWRELALTMTGDVNLDEDALNKEAARLRSAMPARGWAPGHVLQPRTGVAQAWVKDDRAVLAWLTPGEAGGVRVQLQLVPR